MREPRELIEEFERRPSLPEGSGERFAGYGVMAAPFLSGHLLAMRRFPASSLGRGYTSLWHRAPDGRWTFYADAPPTRSCARYFGNALSASEETPVKIEWTGPRHLVLRVPSVDLEWTMDIGLTSSARILNALARGLPDALWHDQRVLSAMARVAGGLLGAGHMQLTGHMPNGQAFTANPQQLWTLDQYSARMGGEDFGPTGPLPEQVKLGDFYLPQRGLFVIGRAFLEATDPAKHHVRAHEGGVLLPV